jgi:hypothetical protein
MPIIFIAAVVSGLSPEAWNAIIVAMVGSFSAFIIARYNAKRQVGQEDTDEGRAFRGELREDNVALRQELRDVKEERDRLKERGLALEAELRQLYEGRLARQNTDKESQARLVELDKGSVNKMMTSEEQ